MPHSQSTLVEVKRIRGKGRGVFATAPIPRGTTFERVPVLVVSTEDIETSALADYAFEWTERTVAIALGYGSLYNHSYSPNARYDDVGRMTKEFSAVRDIAPGEEITINYNGDPSDRTPVEFEVL